MSMFLACFLDARYQPMCIVDVNSVFFGSGKYLCIWCHSLSAVVQNALVHMGSVGKEPCNINAAGRL